MRAAWAKRLRPIEGLLPGRLQIHEIFATIQGEGTRAGLACTMVRTTGCNLRCGYCDTRDAFAGGRTASVTQVLAEVRALGHSLVEVTGGEPLAQPAVPELLGALCDAGHTVLLETSGSLSIDTVDPRVIRIVDIKTPSSGEADANLWANVEHLTERDEVKLVIGDRADYDWAKRIIAEHDLAGRAVVLLGAVWGALDPSVLADWILADRLPVRLQLQLHKLLGVP